jgi:hypothetical protein
MSPTGNGAYTAPFAVISATDRGGQVIIANIIIFILAFLSVALRIHVASRKNRNALNLYKDDLLCFAALVRSLSSLPRSRLLTANFSSVA